MRVSVISIVILLSILPLVSMSHTVRANPGAGVDAPTNIWAPYGPSSPNLLYSFYSNEGTEFNDFLTGHLDLTDWPQSHTNYATYDSNPDFVLSPGQGQFGVYGIDFNYAGSTWAGWGCDWQHANSACGIEIREAFIHLIDRPHFVTDGPLQGAGQAIFDPSPPAKDPSGSTLATQCAWETILADRTCTSAFHLAPNVGGFAQPGSPDFCASVDHLILATTSAPALGLRRNPSNSCAIDPSSPGLGNILSHPIRFMVRNDDPVRLALGQGLVLAINQLFGASVVQPFYGSAVVLRPIVTVSAPLGQTDDWDMYTMGWLLPGPFPADLHSLYDSMSASDQCGGVQNGNALNYGFVCIPSFDTYADGAAQTPSISVFKSDTVTAFNEFGKRAANIPVYARGIRIAALRSMAGLVNSRGVSYPNFWTILDGHNDTGYAPANPLYKFGGGVNEIRWGQKAGTNELNIFNSVTLWEGNVLSEVYDTVLATSPVQPASVFCWMCTNYSTSVDGQGNTHILISLRQNLRWQDGASLDASDVKFSYLNFRDVPAANIVANVQLLLGVTILSPYFLDVTMQGQSISHLINLAGVPIIPRHIWELQGDLKYGDVGRADPAKTNPSYDPIAAGTFVGSGPFLCRSVFPEDLGKLGTGCARNSDGSRGGQSLGPGATLLLQAYDRTREAGAPDPFLQYMRSFDPSWGTGSSPVAAESGQFQEFSWADRYDAGNVGIIDLNSVASCVGKTNSTGCADYAYWVRSALHPTTPNTIGAELTIVASHLDDTWTAPFTWTSVSLENIVPFIPGCAPYGSGIPPNCYP